MLAACSSDDRTTSTIRPAPSASPSASADVARKRGLAAADSDPTFAALAQDVRACKEFQPSCPAYAKKKIVAALTDPAARLRARATFLNWIEEPTSVVIRWAGASILASDGLVDASAASDPKLVARVLAAIADEPRLGRQSANQNVAVELASVLGKLAQAPANRASVASFLADRSYPFPAARAELVRQLTSETLNDPATFKALRIVAEEPLEPTELGDVIPAALGKAEGERQGWARTFLRTVVEQGTSGRATAAVQSLARYGESADAKALVDSLERRKDDSAYLASASLALRTYLGRAELTIDRAHAAMALAKVASDAKLSGEARAEALESLFATGDASFEPLAKKLALDADEPVRLRATDLVEKDKQRKEAQKQAEKEAKEAEKAAIEAEKAAKDGEAAKNREPAKDGNAKR